MRKYLPKNSHPNKFFNPVLFWDAVTIDMERHADYIIARILDYGDQKDIKVLRDIYPDKKLISIIKKRRGIMPQTAKYWAVYFNIPLQEVTCLKKYYQKTH